MGKNKKAKKPGMFAVTDDSPAPSRIEIAVWGSAGSGKKTVLSKLVGSTLDPDSLVSSSVAIANMAASQPGKTHRHFAYFPAKPAFSLDGYFKNKALMILCIEGVKIRDEAEEYKGKVELIRRHAPKGKIWFVVTGAKVDEDSNEQFTREDMEYLREECDIDEASMFHMEDYADTANIRSIILGALDKLDGEHFDDVDLRDGSKGFSTFPAKSKDDGKRGCGSSSTCSGGLGKKSSCVIM